MTGEVSLTEPQEDSPAPRWLASPALQFWAGALAIAVILLCVYWPVLTYQYLYYDDWIHFSNHGSACSASSMYHWSQVTGRLAGQYVLCGLFDSFDRTDQAWHARLLVVAGIITFAILQWVYFRAVGISWSTSLCFTVVTSVLPGMLVFAYWITAGSIVLALLASTTAALLTQIVVSRTGGAVRYALVLAAGGMLTLALVIYQTEAMYFWTLTAVMFAVRVRQGLRSALRPLVIYSLIGFAPMAGYFIWFQYVSGLATELRRIEATRGTMLTNLPANFAWFLGQALPRAASLWLFDFPAIFGVIMMAIFLVSMIWCPVLLWRKLGGTRNQAGIFLAYPVLNLILLLLTFSTMLVTAYRTLTYRSTMPLSALLFLVGALHLGVVARFEMWPPMIRIGLAVGFALGVSSFASSSLISRMVLPASAEYSFIRNSMVEATHQDPAPWRANAVVPLVRYEHITDEFGGPSSRLGQVLAPMMHIMARETGLQIGTVPFSLPGEAFAKEGTLVLDFAEFSKSGLWEAVSPMGSADSEPHVLMNRGDYILFEYKGRIYALPNSAGPVMETSRAIALPGVISGKTINEVLSHLPPGSDSASQPQLLRIHEGNSIVAFRGRFYAVPSRLGELNLTDWKSGKVDGLPGVIIEPTLSDLMSRLSQPVAQDSLPKLLRTYGRYNLVAFRGRIYGVPWDAGVLNLEDWTNRKVDKLHGVVIGATAEEVASKLPK